MAEEKETEGLLRGLLQESGMLHRTHILTEESTYLNRLCGRKSSSTSMRGTSVDVWRVKSGMSPRRYTQSTSTPTWKSCISFLGLGMGRNGKLLFKGDKVLVREKRSIGLGRPVAK